MACTLSSVLRQTMPWCHIPLQQLRNSGINARFYSKGRVPRKSNLRFLSIVGVGTGVSVGAGYSYHRFKQSQKSVLNTGESVSVLKEIPDVEVSHKIVFPNDTSGLQLKLFQYATCPFCCKVRAFLDYYGVSYDVIEVNPVMRQQIKWSQYKKVPIVIAQQQSHHEQLNDSSMIVSALMSYLIDKNMSLGEIIKYYPRLIYKEKEYERIEILNRYFLMCPDQNLDEKTKEAMILERKWRRWVDDTLVHVLSPNVYRTREEALETFSWFSQAGDWEKHFPTWERLIIIYVGAHAMWLISKRLKKRHDLKDDVRQSFYDECNVWMKAIQEKGTQFMGGSTPNLADLAVYGVLNSVEGSRAFQDVLEQTALGKWYWTMKSQIKNHEGSHLIQS